MTVTYQAVTTSQDLQAIGTYTPSSAATIQYGTGLTGTGTTSRNLEVTLRYPTDLSEHIAIPLILVYAGGGFSTMNRDSDVSVISDFASMGAVCVSFDYRTETDTPWSHHQAATDSDKSNAIRAAIIDARRGVEWVMQRKDNSNYTIDTRRVCAYGTSSGFQLFMMYAIENPSHNILGACNFRAGFGLDGFGGTATADLRAFHDESEWVNSQPPMVSFLGDSDTVIGTTYIASMKARLDLDAANNTFLKVGSNHENIDDYGNVTSLFTPFDSVAPMEEMRRFWNDLMSGVSSEPSTKATFT